ncbi:hypothetical protein WN944_009352 [Citrus x changshan-huyou]|uniref:Uncharacterized protein n=1 Tax=Citrus x changshan-huyou TaxID=2935761 RepID=A0AAP0MPL1_9ROSI
MISNASLDACYGLRKQENPQWGGASTPALGDEGTNLGAELKYRLVELMVLMNMLWGEALGLRKKRMTNIGAELRFKLAELMVLSGTPNISDIFPVLSWFDIQGYNLGWNQHHNYNGGMDNGIIDTASTSNGECKGRTKSGRGH